MREFVTHSEDQQLERDELRRFLGELDEEFGPVPEELVEHFDGQWPS